MKKLFILTIMMVALSSCASNCHKIGRGMLRCDYGKNYCLESYKGLTTINKTGLQCFEK